MQFVAPSSLLNYTDHSEQGSFFLVHTDVW